MEDRTVAAAAAVDVSDEMRPTDTVSTKAGSPGFLLEERLKVIERQSEHKVPPYLPFLARLDGHAFSKFTSGLRKPFDLAFTRAMALTAADLMLEFSSCATAYTHSDEITLIFPAACTREQFDSKDPRCPCHPYNARIQKMVSLLAGFASARFIVHMNACVNEVPDAATAYKPSMLSKIKAARYYFDARIMVMENPADLVAHQKWRSIDDCRRNCISTVARFHLGQRALDYKTCTDMLDMLKAANVDLDAELPLFLMHGVYIKKELYSRRLADTTPADHLDPARADEMVVRSRLRCYAFKVTSLPSASALELLLAKYWPSTVSTDGAVFQEQAALIATSDVPA